MTIKKVKEEWINEFTNRLDKEEGKQFRKVRDYYKAEYFRAIEEFLQSRKTSGWDGYFQSSRITALYSVLYSTVAGSFAYWYSKGIQRLTKQQDVSGYETTWEAAFAAEGERIAGKRVTLVQGTAKATLIKELTRFMKDPDFMDLNERQAQRVLRSRFNQYSNNQARRLVRTEATNAANLGTMRSALDMFGADSLQKEWIAALDERTRGAHASASGQVVDFNEPFFVMGEKLNRPGDPAGTAKNVINCRCSVAPFPREDAQAISQLDSIDFDVAQEAFDPTDFGLTARTIAPVVESAITIASEASSLKEARQMFKDLFGEVDINVKRLTLAKNVDVEDVNAKMTEFKRLMNKYKVNPKRAGSEISLRLTGGADSYGSVSYYPDARLPDRFRHLSGKVTGVDFGENYESFDFFEKNRIKYNRTRERDINGFSNRGKSPVDEDKMHLATITHETAHFIDVSMSGANPDFFQEMNELFDKYILEKGTLRKNKNVKAYNEIFLGRYASTDVDEFFAEGFTEYELNSNPSKYAKLIGELTLKYYKR